MRIGVKPYKIVFCPSAVALLLMNFEENNINLNFFIMKRNKIGIIALLMISIIFAGCKNDSKGTGDCCDDNKQTQEKAQDTVKKSFSLMTLNQLLIEHKKHPKNLEILHSVFGDHRTPKVVFEYNKLAFWEKPANVKTITFDKTKIQSIITAAGDKDFVCFKPTSQKDMDDIAAIDFSKPANYTSTHDPYISLYPIAMFEFIRDNMDTEDLEVTKGTKVVHTDTNKDGKIDYKDKAQVCDITMFRIEMKSEIYYLDIVEDPSVTYP